MQTRKLKSYMKSVYNRFFRNFQNWGYSNNQLTKVCKSGGQLLIQTTPNRWEYSVVLSPINGHIRNREVSIRFKVLKGEVGISICDKAGKLIGEKFYGVSPDDYHMRLFVVSDDAQAVMIRNSYSMGASSVLIAHISRADEHVASDADDILKISHESLTFCEAVNWSQFYGLSFPVTQRRGLRSVLLTNQEKKFVFETNDLKINCYPEDENSRAFFLSGYYEPIESLAIKNLVKQGDIFLDIGANQGFHSLQVAKETGALIYAFEPSSREYSRLLENIDLNTLSQITVHNLALGNVESKLKLLVGDYKHTGHNTLCGHFVYSTTQKLTEETVQVSTLDNFVKEHKLINVNFIKLDVEGFEVEVFKGARETLQKFKPNILFELARSRFEDPDFFYGAYRELISCGYKFYVFNAPMFCWEESDYGNINIACSIIASVENSVAFLIKLNQSYQQKFIPSRVEDTRDESRQLVGTDVFLYGQALAINEARLEHLASLEFDFNNKHVLEVGGGIGLHTPFFLSQGAKVHFTDARQENLEKAKETLGDLVTYELLDLNLPPDRLEYSKFDYVYCYGTLYHLSKPEIALKFLSSFSAEKIFLETCISNEDNSLVNLVDEDIATNNQAFDGLGCRPSQKWILTILATLWGKSFEAKTAPNNLDFPADTSVFTSSRNTRSIFVGSTEMINSNIWSTEPVYERRILKSRSHIAFSNETGGLERGTSIHHVVSHAPRLRELIMELKSKNLILVAHQAMREGHVIRTILNGLE